MQAYLNERGRDDFGASLPKYKPHFRTLKTPFATDNGFADVHITD
jgi:hypothetical protein